MGNGRIRICMLVALAVVAAACGSGGGGSSASSGTTPPDETTSGGALLITVPAPGPPRTGGKLIYGIDAESQGFNPATNAFSQATNVVANAVYDPLMAIDADGELKPYLVESLTPNEDYTAYTFKLRPGVTFHNGEPLNAAALAVGVEALRTSPLVGSAAKPVTGTEVVDDLTLRVDLGLSWPAFPWLFVGQVGFVPAPATLADPQGARAPIGTGPFVFESWSPDSSLKMKRNDNYWRDGLPYLAEVEFRPLPDPTSRLAALESGDVDMIHNVSPTTRERLVELAEDGRIQLAEATGETEEVFVMINTERITDVRVRQAMAYAIDPASILQTVGIPVEDMAEGPFAKDSQWTVETDMPRADPDRAAELVAEVEAESGPIEVSLGALPISESTQLAQLVAQAWEAAGISVDLESMEQAAYVVRTATGDYDTTLFRMFGSNDPDLDGVFWHSDQVTDGISLNMARNKDPQVDEALFVGRSSPDLDARKGAYATVQERFAATVPYLWLYHTKYYLAASTNTFGFADQTLPDGSRSAVFRGGSNRLTEVWVG